MQTFLPYRDFYVSAKLLDKKRCFKQVVEADQILTALSCKATGMIYITDEGHSQHEIRGKFFTDVKEDALLDKRGNPKKVGWVNHPAVLMWEGHMDTLKTYFNVFLKVSVELHKYNTQYKYITDINMDEAVNNKPWWLGIKKFHRAMRARLIEKDEEFYLPKFPDDKGYNNSMYFWPVMENKTFRLI